MLGVIVANTRVNVGYLQMFRRLILATHRIFFLVKFIRLNSIEVIFGEL